MPSPIRLVIDTNVLVPGIVGASANPPAATASASLIRAWRAGHCTVLVNEELLDEYRDVLERHPFRVPPSEAAWLCSRIAAHATSVDVRRSKPLLTKDPDDDFILKLAVAGKANFLVTSNAKDFAEVAALRGGTSDLRYRGVQVVGLGACLAAIRTNDPEAESAMRRLRGWT